MNFSLAKEIYSLTPWMMDVHSIPVMSAILENIKNGIPLEVPEVKLNTPFIYDIKNETRIITKPYGDGWSIGQLENSDDFEGIAVININGPITKSGGASTVGMDSISSLMYKMSKDSRIKAFIIQTDSGGGSSAAVEIMMDTISDVKKVKPVYALITKGGMAASAAYGIISACTAIYSESNKNIVGSIGTMIQFKGRAANSEDSDGFKHIRLYATKSTQKNKGFEESLNNNNYTVLINDLLDPINEEFIGSVLSNRPQLKDVEFDSGKTYFAEKVIGTFIDGIKSFSELVSLISSEKSFKSSQNNSKSGINNNKKMTKSEFKSANPEAYNEILAEGAAQRTDQVGAWMAHVNTDAEAVSQGVASGKDISQSQREIFFVKQNSQKVVKNMVSESADDVVINESLTDVEKIANENKKKEIESAFDFELD